MGENNRKTADSAVEQIMRNITSDVNSGDGQYRQLGFPLQAQSAESWNIPNQIQTGSFAPQFDSHVTDTPMSYQTVNNQQFNVNHQSHVYREQYGNEHLNGNDLYNYNMYQNVQCTPNIQELGMYSSEYKFFIPQMYQNINTIPSKSCMHGYSSLHNDYQQSHNRTPIIDNLVGNWTPNTSGTYSPFGNVVGTNLFDVQTNGNITQETDYSSVNRDQSELRNEDLPNFQFNRDTKKPRIIAEVKPMRPRYSDVLLKSVPPLLKTGKPEVKEIKNKKDAKKSLKNDKCIRQVGLNRSNTNNDIKDMYDKNSTGKNNDKNIPKHNQNNQLNRNWVSLDNVTESSSTTKKGSEEMKKDQRKPEEVKPDNTVPQSNYRKTDNTSNEPIEKDVGNVKNDFVVNGRNIVKRGVKKQRNHETLNSSDQRPPGKRNQRNRKRGCQFPLGYIQENLKFYMCKWWKFIIRFILWLLHLISDVCSLSWNLIHEGGCHLWNWIVTNLAIFSDVSSNVLNRIHFFKKIREKFKKNKGKEEKRATIKTGLKTNITMPTTGDEAMKRLLACKGKDPYSILGVTPTCTDDDIKRYYKRQAVLVHPDKNKQPGAEEAFKILVHAFDIIGEPEKRGNYDKGVAESVHVEQAWTELTELLAKFQQKVEAASKIIRCSNCGSGHERVKVDRPSYAARNCNMCKIRHSAREGDIWAEARCMGFLWHYYTCMEGNVYDITEWAGCQKDSLKQLKPDTHNVQYRIALGKYNNTCKKHYTSPKIDSTADLENLLHKFYNQGETPQNLRRKNKKNGNDTTGKK